MSTTQITLRDCLTEINNALNYWYPLPVRESKLDEELGRYRPYGASREECDARHVRLFQFRDRLQEQLKQAGKAADFDLAMAMAELRSVAAERDKLKSELAVAEEKMDAQSCVLDGCRIQRDAAVIQRDSSWWSLSRAKESLRAAEADLAETESVNSDLRTVTKRLVADLAAAMERLNHAESIIMQ